MKHPSEVLATKVRHSGGGTMLTAIGTEYPCDDTYEDEAGNKFDYDTTEEAHFSMPVDTTLGHLEQMSGVRLRRVHSE